MTNQLVINAFDNWIEAANGDIEAIAGTWTTATRNSARALILYHAEQKLEKLMKAIYVAKYHSHARTGHDLLSLARWLDLPEIVIDGQFAAALMTISGFNSRGRYPDIGLALIEQCTQDYVIEWTATIDSIYEEYLLIAHEHRKIIPPDAIMQIDIASNRF